MSPKLKSLFEKISISIISFLFFLSILEIGLRTAGYIIARQRSSVAYEGTDEHAQEERFGHIIRQTESRDEDKRKPSQKKVYTILCIGDSYTFGGTCDFDQTYPAKLQKRLNALDSNIRFSVINGGSCEYNSSQVLRRLPVLFKDYDPDAVMLLVGAANNFNFALYDKTVNPLIQFIHSLRVYKMFRIVKLNVEKKFYSLFLKSKKAYDPELIGADGYQLCKPRWQNIKECIDEMSALENFESDYEKAWYLHNKGRYEEAIDLCKNYLKDSPDDEQFLCLYGYLIYQKGDIETAEEIFNRVYNLYPDSEQTLSWNSYFYNSLCRWYVNNDYRYDIRMLCLALKFEPYYDLHAYYNLAHAYPMQSTYEASYVVDFLENMLRGGPGLKKHHMFRKYYEYFQNQEKWSEDIEQWLRGDLEKIVEFCKDRGAELIIQNYPYNYPMANSILEEVARKYSLPFVDNNSVFNDIVDWFEVRNRRKYLYDDNHCTDKGHDIMVENIVKVLLRDIIR